MKTKTTLEKRLEKLEREMKRLQERERSRPRKNENPALSPSDTFIVEALRSRAGGAYEKGKTRGAIAYAGAVRFDEDREYLWEMERAAPGLLTIEPEVVARLLSSLASPARIVLLRALLPGPKSSQDLQKALGVSSPGQLYHHLKELVSTGIVEQKNRSDYQIAARNVVPFLTIVAVAIDLAGSPR